MFIMGRRQMYLKNFYSVKKRILLFLILIISLFLCSCDLLNKNDKKLSREDFKVSGNNSITNSCEDDNFLSLFSSNDTFGIATFVEGDDVFTNRNITLGNTIYDVEKVYGKRQKKIFNESTDTLLKFIYEKVESIFDLNVLSDGDIYTEYEWNDNDKKYYIRFFYDNIEYKTKLIMFYFGI